MRKNREFIEGAFYHVTSRTNNRVSVFDKKIGQELMLLTLQNAKEKFQFCLTNFCIMPTHIHLLIKPKNGDILSNIMQWIKTRSAKRWNFIHHSNDHLWGQRYFARVIQNMEDYSNVMNYIDKNPVEMGLASAPSDWKASGSFYKLHNITGLVDYTPQERLNYIKLIAPIPHSVSLLIPPFQLKHVLNHLETYSDAIDHLYTSIPMIPQLGITDTIQEPIVYLRYFTETVDYLIQEYDGVDTMYGKVCNIAYPNNAKSQKLKLTQLKGNKHIKLDFHWKVQRTNDRLLASGITS